MQAPRKSLVLPLVLVAAAAAIGLGYLTKRETIDVRPPTRSRAEFECGHYAVLRVCELLGIPVSPGAVRDLLPANNDGHSLKQLADALGRLGLTARGRKESLDSFLTKSGIRIVHMSSPDHFIVVARSSPDRVAYFDNWGRHQHFPSSVLKKRWSGNVLYVERLAAVSRVDPTQADGMPRIEFGTLFIDKGDIPLTATSQKIEYAFPIRNVGSTDLVIRKVHTDCRCLAAKAPDKAIPPGGESSIRLEYSVDGRRRTFIHEAIVETNDSRLPVVILRAAGNVDTLVSVSPAILDLGEIPIGGEKRAYLLVRYSGEAEFDLGAVKLSAGLTSLTLRETTDQSVIDRLWPRASGQVKVGTVLRVLEVVARPSSEQLGNLSGEITIQTNVPSFERMAVAVKGSIVQSVAMIPSLLTFGEIGADDQRVCSVSLISLIDRPINLISVGPTESGLAWTVRNSIDDGKRLEVSFTAIGSVVHKVSGKSLAISVECDGRKFELRLPVFAWQAGSNK